MNGDGLTNDRAFVFDPSTPLGAGPATAGDAALAADMRRLLDAGPNRVRDCLGRQRGTVAAEHSCRGPWNAALGVIALTLDSHRVGLGSRGSVSLYVTNALGGLDQLLHRGDRLRGWGQLAFPEQTLLTPRGFDPAAARFRYAVNPRFGGTSSSGLLFRRPASLTVDVRLEIGPHRESQAVEHWFKPQPAGWGFVAHPDSLGKQLHAQGDVMSGARDIARILRRATALRLTPAQVDTLTAMDRRLRATRDSIYTDLGRYLVARNGDYRGREVRVYWHQAIAAAATSVYETSRRLREVLTPEQLAAERAQYWPLALLDYSPTWLARVTREPFFFPW